VSANNNTHDFKIQNKKSENLNKKTSAYK